MILALDPSSRAIGYAVLKGLDRGDLVEAGVIRPGTFHTEDVALAEQLKRKDLAAAKRVMSMMIDLSDLFDTHNPSQCVVEWPSGKAGTGSRRGASGSLTTYGAAVGAVLMYCMMRGCPSVIPVTEREWTPACGSKMVRSGDARMFYGRGYDWAHDTGRDMSDAIMLGRWWLKKAAVLGRGSFPGGAGGDEVPGSPAFFRARSAEGACLSQDLAQKGKCASSLGK